MRILIVTPYLPWPLDEGGRVAQFATLESLASDHQFTVLAQIYSEAQRDHARELARRLPNVRVREVLRDEATPISEKAVATRMLETLVTTGRKWTQPSRGKAAPRATHPWYPFRPLPHKLIDAVHDELQRGYDLVQCEFAQTMPLGVALPSDVPSVFVHHQLVSVSSERHLQVSGRTAYGEYITAVVTTQETAYLNHFDAIITFSETDRGFLAGRVHSSRVYASPFPVPERIACEDELPSRFGGSFIFIGSENHGANQDALTWLLESIWPQIVRELPGAELLVIGKWSSHWKTGPQTRGVNFAGYVENLDDVTRAGIMLVPVRIGSGIRTKILLAYAAGVPVVTTEVGKEGLVGEDGNDLMVADNSSDFADAAVALARDAALWRRLAGSGLNIAANVYSPEAVRRKRNEIYEAVISRPAQVVKRKFA